jgi:hypothetical protein
MKAILVAGTHAWRADGRVAWYHPDSVFAQRLKEMGVQIVGAHSPFTWSTELGGVGFGDDDLVVWKAAGINLLHYAVPPLCPEHQIPSSDLVVISHSHGLQVVLCAAAAGLKIDTFIDICGPVRKDMMSVAQLARPNIRRWVHMYGGKRDRWQWFGEMFDGHIGVVREHKLADHNIGVNSADHRDILADPELFPIIVQALGQPES